jgi:sodium-dependent dicarboxylate transporter 2/3/5
MHQVGLDKSLFRFTLRRFGRKPNQLLLGLMLTTALGSMVMSDTATTAMMVSSVLPIAHLMGKDSPFTKALLIGIPAAATLGGMGTIIGSTPNAIAVGALQEKGISITFVEWMAFGLPTALISIYIFWKFLIRKLDLAEVEIDWSSLISNSPDINRFERNSVIFTLILTVSMWLTEPIHGVPIAATSAIPIVLLTIFQVIKAEDVRRLPWDTLMLVAGGLALGIAMVEVGLTDIVMDRINTMSIATVGVAAIFAIIGVLISNIMSNTAASSILVPLALSLPGLWGLTVPLIVALSCSCALLLPVSTPSNAISFSTGMITQKDFRPGGLLMIGVGPLLAFLVVLLYGYFFIQ